MTKLTGLMKDETVICSMKVNKLKSIVYLLFDAIVPTLVLLYCLVGIKAVGIELILSIITSVALYLIFTYYFISNLMMCLNTTYRLTNQRIICDDMCGFKRNNQSFYYKVVKDIQVVKMPILNYYNVEFIIDKANKYKEVTNNCTFYAISKSDVDLIVSCLNKYSNYNGSEHK